MMTAQSMPFVCLEHSSAESAYVTLLRAPCSSGLLACFSQRQRYYLIGENGGLRAPQLRLSPVHPQGCRAANRPGQSLPPLTHPGTRPSHTAARPRATPAPGSTRPALLRGQGTNLIHLKSHSHPGSCWEPMPAPPRPLQPHIPASPQTPPHPCSSGGHRDRAGGPGCWAHPAQATAP